MHRNTAALAATSAAFVLIGGIQVATAAEIVGGDALRSAISGKTIHVSTAIGSVPVSFRSNGTMSGIASGIASYAVAGSDQGRWWVSGDRLCQQWDTWLKGATHCFTMRREGRTLYWTGAGRSGTAMISN